MWWIPLIIFIAVGAFFLFAVMEKGSLHVTHLNGSYLVMRKYLLVSNEFLTLNRSHKPKFQTNFQLARKFESFESAKAKIAEVEAYEKKENAKPEIVKEPVKKVEPPIARAIVGPRGEILGVHDTAGNYIDLTSKDSYEEWKAGDYAAYLCQQQAES